jgi:hypothetical protein
MFWRSASFITTRRKAGALRSSALGVWKAISRLGLGKGFTARVGGQAWQVSNVSKKRQVVGNYSLAAGSPVSALAAIFTPGSRGMTQ